MENSDNSLSDSLKKYRRQFATISSIININAPYQQNVTEFIKNISSIAKNVDSMKIEGFMKYRVVTPTKPDVPVSQTSLRTAQQNEIQTSQFLLTKLPAELDTEQKTDEEIYKRDISEKALKDGTLDSRTSILQGWIDTHNEFIDLVLEGIDANIAEKELNKNPSIFTPNPRRDNSSMKIFEMMDQI